jgi:hypothetical protein
MRRRLAVLLFCLCGVALLASGRDLARDESMGGHTLARHVGRTDAELRSRLAKESGISAASTWTDRATAERVVGEALDRQQKKVAEWVARRGSRPNLALRYRSADARPIGRSLERGTRAARDCRDVVIVLRWDDRRRDYFVLTSYPELR